MNEIVKEALQSFGIRVSDDELAILTDGYSAAHAVAARLHDIPLGTTPPASLLNPAPMPRVTPGPLADA